ncbi:MAG: 50S ribosomal protein L25/general stress protein Ctc [Demequina sp.]
MSDKLTLAAEHRTEFGKGFARRIRAANKIPAVLYGHGTEPDHIVLPGHETMMALKNPNALLTIEIDGEKTLAIAKDVQRDPIKPLIVHVDLLIVKKGEKIIVDVPVHLEGESAPGTIHVLEINSLQILAEATHLPEYITVSIEGMDDGDKLLAGDITLPKGSELDGDPEQLIVHISVPRTSVEDEVADAAVAAEVEDAKRTAEDESSDNEN